MYKIQNANCLRFVLLSLVAMLSLSMSACCVMTSKAEEMEATEEPMMEETMMEEMETTEMMAEEMPPLVVSDDIHIVSAGESLWAISGMTSIYNDSYRWPLIYRRNLDINDADLIFPGQELAIPRDLTRADIDSAVAHAKNRGAWELGVIEETDLIYRGSM